ncbi:Sulfotransferase [Rhynchospora pubera]|uniref:Sulfotransferase n=1 Tax=Rhynchospora pubera TaxID=906938 RepID=A0AAV8FNN0_9POAL|nr:Sulfotransferase [Rhynchospora pubera]
MLTLGTTKMANYETVCPAGVPVPYKTILEANSRLIENPPEEHNALIATLPIHSFIMRPATFQNQLRLYKGNWINQSFLRGALAMQQHFKSSPTDLFLASFPKSGTTWLKAMIFATMTRTSYPLNQHPLCTHNPHQCITSIEKEFSIGNSQIIEAIPSPRAMSTHLQYSILPESITNTDCRIIYVWRDPKMF